MSRLNDLETAVKKLSPDELASFRVWFAQFDASRWDDQLEEDAADGRLDALADEALRDLREGRCTDL